MEHHEAIEMQASERYLLGELPPAQRESFEEHYFECPVCAEDVRLGTALADNAKAVFDDPALRRYPAATGRSASRWAWLRLPQLVPVGAAIAFAAIAGVEFVQLSQLRQPQGIFATVIPPASKGDRRVVKAHPGEPFIQLSFNVDAVDAPGPYRCELAADSGKQILSLKTATPPPGAPLILQLPASMLAPGGYTMSLHADTAPGAGRELERYPFTLEKN